MAPQKGECGKKKGKVRKNTVKVHKDVQEYSTDKTCGARERKNARNSITKVVCFRGAMQSVRTAQGNNARMQEKNSGREPVVWVVDVRCEGVDCRQNTRTQECKNARNVPKWRKCFIFTVRKCIKVGEKMEIQG